MSSAVATQPRDSSHHYLLSALPDERLAKLAAQGSTPAFAAIYNRHHQAIYRYCQSLIGNEQDARDALQETMIKAMRGLTGEPREIALRPWLFRIAHNESVSLMRRRPPSAPLDSVGELPDYGGDADLARERVRELFEDLSQLTPRQRGALVMRELNGLGFQEIAAAMAISPAAAKQTVYEARQALLDVAKGRDADCREVRERISARDRRLLRGRAVSAHLRSCADCREFEAGVAARSTSLAAVAPLPAAASAGILQSVIGAAGGGAGGGGIALAVAGGSLGAVAKLGVAGVVALGVGTLAIETRDSGPKPASGGSVPVIERASSAPANPSPGAAGTGATPGKGSGGGADRGHGVEADAPQAGGAANSPAGGASAGGATHGSSADQSAPPESPPAAGASEDAGSGSGGGAGGAAGGAGGDTGPATGSGSAGGSTEGGGSTGGEALPPGQGSTPPGQGGTPPGLGGQVPPGQGGTPPGLGGNVPPGQGGTPPGQGGTPPGQGGTPPGQSGSAPGQTGDAPPGQGGSNPGQGNGHN